MTRRSLFQRITGFISAAFAVGFGRKAKAEVGPRTIVNPTIEGGCVSRPAWMYEAHGRVGRYICQVRANSDGTFSRRDTRDYGATWSEWRDFPEFLISKCPVK